MTDQSDRPQARYVRELMERAGLTQAELARRTGKGARYWWLVLNGRSAVSTADTARRLVDALGIPGVTGDDILAADGRLDPEIVAFLTSHPSMIRTIRGVMAKAKGTTK